MQTSIIGSPYRFSPKPVVRSPYAAPPAAGAQRPPAEEDRVDLTGVEAPAAPCPTRSLGKGAALAGLVALTLLGGLATPALAQAPPVPACSQSGTPIVQVPRNPALIADTRTYIADMLENNHVQGRGLNTYDKMFQNNYNTLVHIEQRIVKTPEALADAGVRRVYEKIVAALDSIQVFRNVEETIHYQAGEVRIIQAPDGSRVTVPMQPVTRTAHVTGDFSGATSLTDHTLEQIDVILHAR